MAEADDTSAPEGGDEVELIIDTQGLLPDDLPQEGVGPRPDDAVGFVREADLPPDVKGPRPG